MKMDLKKSPDWMKLLPIQRRELMNRLLTSGLLPTDDIQSQQGGQLQNVLGLQEDLPKSLKLILDEIGKHFALLKRGVGGQEVNKFLPVTSSFRDIACSLGSRMMEVRTSKELERTQQANVNAVLETKLEETRQFSGAAEVDMENTIQEKKQTSNLLLHKETLLITLQILREKLENLEKTCATQAIIDTDKLKDVIKKHEALKRNMLLLTEKLDALSLKGSIPCSYVEAKAKLIERKAYLSDLRHQLEASGVPP